MAKEQSSWLNQGKLYLQENEWQDTFLSLMIIASMREKRFMGIVIDCLFGARVDGYLAAAAVQKAISLHALPLEDFEDCLQQGIAQIKCGKLFNLSSRLVKNNDSALVH